MSTFWTPSGERPIPKDPILEEQAPASAPPSRPPATGRSEPGDASFGDEQYSEEEMRAEMLAMQEQLLRTPAVAVVANHGIGMLELAALHLGQEPPNLGEAAVAIDGLAGLLDAVGARMGGNEAPLRQALNQLRMAFIEAKDAAAGPTG